MTYYTSSNIDNFKSTLESYTGDIYNIYNDGSAITLGNEPGISIDSWNLNADWSVIVIFKTSSLLTECIWSIDDGAGGRYMDVYHSGGNTVTLHFGGVDTSIQYTDEVTLPVDQWIAVGFNYDISENTISFGAHYAGVNHTITGPKYIDYLPATVPAVLSSEGRIFRFFRPAHVDSSYFNGSIDTFYITAFNNPNPIIHASQYIFTSVSQASGWANWVNRFSRFTAVDDLPVVSYSRSTNPNSKYSNFCPYDDFYVCAFARESWGSVTTLGGGATTATNVTASEIFYQTANTGMHYFHRNNKLVYVNASTYSSGIIGQLYYYLPNGTVRLPTEKVQITTAAANGTYTTCRGDRHGRYLFGTKLAIDGTTHQLFRTDPDGLNEITVDCLTLLGVNGKVGTYVCNPDDDLLYFAHPTTFELKSVDYNLANLNETYTLVLNSLNRDSIEYSDGYLYYGGKNPNSDGANASLWKYNLETETNVRLSYAMDINTHLADLQIMFVDRPNNRMILSGNGTFSYIQFEVDTETNKFAVPGFYKAFGDDTSINLSWDPITSATGYNVLQDGVVVASNITDTRFTATGLVNDTEYRFTLEHTIDGTNFIPNKYINTIYHTSNTATFFAQSPDLYSYGNLSSDWGFADPYTAEELLINVTNNMYKYNVITNEMTLATAAWQLGVGGRQRRQLSNKRLYQIHWNTTKIIDFGIEGSSLVDAGGNVGTYINNPANIVFDHSVSSGGDIANLLSFDSSLDGNSIYYSTQDEDLWKYDVLSGISTLLYAGVGTSNMRGVSLDPLDQNSLCFYDNQILKHINLDTLVVTELKTAMSISYTCEVLGGVVYGHRWYGSFFKINVDGTGYEDLLKPGANFNGLFLDTINKRVILYENTSIKVYADPSMADLPDDPSLFTVLPRPISLDMSWQPIDGALGYGIKYTIGAKDESTNFITSAIFTDKLSHPVRNLQPGSTYTLYLYYTNTSAEPSILIGSSTKNTLENLPGNYDSSSYADESGDGSFDFTSLNADALATLGEVMNELFDTGAEVNFVIGGGGATKATFLKRGETAQVEEGSSIAIPFTASAGGGQSATLTLSDMATTVTVDYDESSGKVSLDGGTTEYASGESFVLDGKKVTVYTI